MHHVRLLWSGILALGLLVVAPTPAGAETSGSAQIIPTAVVSDSGYVYAAYENSTETGIIFASNRSGAWVKRTVATGPTHQPVIGVDSSGRVAIVYQRHEVGSTAEGLYLASNRSGTWTTTRLPLPYGYALRVAVTANGRIHLVYGRDDGPIYATNASGTWKYSRLGGQYASLPVIALDAAERPHIVFGDCLDEDAFPCGGLLHRWQTAAGWQQEPLTDWQLDWAQDLRFDAAGRMQLVYIRDGLVQGYEDSRPEGVFHLIATPTATRITRMAGSGRMARMTVDASGRAHVLFVRMDVPGLFYATNRTGAWVRSTVAAEKSRYPSLAIDGDGRLHGVFFRAAIDPGVYYLRKTPTGSWTKVELLD